MSGFSESKLRGIANLAQQGQHYQMIEDRKRNGLSVFVADVKGYEDKNLKELAQNLGLISQMRAADAEDRFWKLIGLRNKDGEPIGGLFKVSNEANQTDFDEIHALLDTFLKNRDWYESHATLTEMMSNLEVMQPNPHDLSTDYMPPAVKLLGKNGENLAVDPIILSINTDGYLTVLAGNRPTGEVALPGGMVESSVETLEKKVKGTCANELLEEVFGGSLFDGESRNSHDADKLYQANIREFSIKADAALAAFSKEFKLPITDDRIVRVKKILLGKFTMQEKMALVANFINRTAMTPFEKHHFLIRLKCNLFEHLLPTEYAEFKRFVFDKMEMQNKVINQSDPRGTLGSYMATYPVVGLFTTETVNELCSNCGIAIKAGDDLEKPKFKRIEAFGDAYSDHAKLVIDVVAKKVESGELVLSDHPKIVEQLKVLELVVLRKDQYIRDGVQSMLTVALTVKDRPKQESELLKNLGVKLKAGAIDCAEALEILRPLTPRSARGLSLS